MGPVTALLIALYFTRQLQGYYFTFGSILGLQIFAELGLGTVIIQFASHEWSRLNLAADGRVEGGDTALSRLGSLVRLTLRWYAVAAIAVALGLGWGGYLFLASTRSQDVRWAVPWLVLCLLAGIKLSMVPLWSVLEGCNQVGPVYGYRLAETLLTSLAVWLAILLGAGLWVPSVSTLVGIVAGLVFVKHRYWRFFGSLLAARNGPSLSWRHELWPMQWKIALSWMSGYFVFLLFVPVLFHYQGAVVAGQMGMTWNMVGALSGVSSMWVMTKAPRFGILIAEGNYPKLDSLFKRYTVTSVLVAACGAVALWLLTYGLYRIGHPLAARILPPLPTGLFLAATVAQQASIPQAVYLRAHKQEPLLWLSVASAVCVGLSTWLLGSHYGATGMAAGYLLIMSLFVLPCSTLVWYRCRLAWSKPRIDDSNVMPRAVPAS